MCVELPFTSPERLIRSGCDGRHTGGILNKWINRSAFVTRLIWPAGCRRWLQRRAQGFEASVCVCVCVCVVCVCVRSLMLFQSAGVVWGVA